ncbi:KAP family P-loop NTPase fold protein [Xanthocytophaga flava]|uniref:KAP family P-loop NTPase fold protein n=1 Tax=Xanthocytophaga flava TaxID=3048013 RepID=UPI0028D14F62|nr:P-loop NTPase fold protein [Xanthocytophaga flavus]MDJ1466960.1 P-loop NTPase fold protein [Xanthocytophaga flavus]
MNVEFLSDNPITKAEDDKLQRYTFSMQIANIILNRRDKDSLTIGIFGAWGEGKTSVLNFIQTALKDSTLGSDVIILDFNPWRYINENTLLRFFFKKVVTALETDSMLSSSKDSEELRKFRNGGMDILKDLSQIGDNISDLDLESIKARIDKYLSNHNRKLVVFIDDIDRLDNKEIYTTFQLVRLIGNFANTTYILAFDEQIVASAIGERFGKGGYESGRSFLEKIIQVPLKLPKVRQGDLNLYCIELITHNLLHIGIELSEKDYQRFYNLFTSYLSIRLSTPRQAIRYSNALLSVMPLLEGEVNRVDLMLMEAIKVLYPKHYNFIYENEDLFVGNLVQERRNQHYKNQLQTLTTFLNEKEIQAIEDLLNILFPLTRDEDHIVWMENEDYTKEPYLRLVTGKHIASAIHFNRYFSYSLGKDELSDLAFEKFIQNLSSHSLEENTKHMESLINQSSPSTFFEKLRLLEYDKGLRIEIARLLTKIIAINSQMFPGSSNIITYYDRYHTIKARVGAFIYALIRKYSTEQVSQFEWAKELMIVSQPFDFAYNINSWLRSGEDEQEQLFTYQQYVELAKVLKDRAIAEAGNSPIFVILPDLTAAYLLRSWAEYNKREMHEYVESFLKNDSSNVKALIRSFSRTGYSSLYPDPFKINFEKNDYLHFRNIFDVDFVYEIIKKEYNIEYPLRDIIWKKDYENGLTENDLINHFVHWYGLDQQGQLL